MAKITPSPIVSNIRGKIGNLIFQRWKSLNICRNMPIGIHNPSTSRQSIVRNLLSSLRTAYGNLSIDQKVAWGEYAQSLSAGGNADVGTYQLIRPQGTVMSGYNVFIGTNSRLNQMGLPVVLVPPAAAIAGPTDIAIADRDFSSGFGLHVNLSETAAVGDYVRVFCKGSWPSSHTYLYDTHAITSDDITAGFVYMEVRTIRAGSSYLYGDLPIGFYYGKELAFQSDIIGIAGYKSSNSNVITKTITNTVATSLVTLFDLTAPLYQADCEAFAVLMGITGYTGVQWFAAMVVNFCVLNDIDWNVIVDVADMTAAAIPVSIKLEVEGGYLPEISGYDSLVVSYVPL